MKKFFQAIFTFAVESLGPTCFGMVLWVPLFVAPFHPEKALPILPATIGLWVVVGIVGARVLD